MSVIQHLPRPAWHLVPVRNYFLDNWTTGISMGRNMPIIASRGCPYQCTFCSSPTMWTTRYVMRSAESVVDEIEWLMSEYGANSIDFQDLTAIIKKPWILEFCHELERRGINITWQLPSGTRSEALDVEVLAAMKRTGCHLIVYAPESGSMETLKAIKKRVDLDRITASMREAVALNMVVKVNLVIGFPDERPINIFKTLAFGMRMAFLGANDVNIAIFSPYPGSELYRELLASGVLPQPTDDYFRNLLSQFELVSPITFCRRMPTWTIVPIRLAGFALFYCLAYLLHPSRMLRVARATLSNSFRPGNLFEQRMSDLFARRRIHTNI
jgi:radical SAM superfamily enzyme YgiQ (UPF0313 family)